ncbi:MAG: transposase [Clostridiales bacterium]|jgi:transposase|nr:transposase [Clostridiales bacterium]
MSYDKKYRKQAIENLAKGYSYRETAKIFGISPNTLNTWVRKYEETGSLEDAPPKRNPRKINGDDLKAYVSEHPDAYQSEIAKQFECSQQAVCKAMKRHKITRKKR